MFRERDEGKWERGKNQILIKIKKIENEQRPFILSRVRIFFFFFLNEWSAWVGGKEAWWNWENSLKIYILDFWSIYLSKWNPNGENREEGQNKDPLNEHKKGSPGPEYDFGFEVF